MLTKKVSIKNPMVSSLEGKRIRLEAGVDILERKRIKEAIKRYKDRFLKRVYTQREIKSFPEKKEIYYSINFSLKEAFWKTLPEEKQKTTYFDDIEIIWKREKPEIFLFREKTKNVEISFYFNKNFVVSSVIRECD